jgi:hypothetical protein
MIVNEVAGEGVVVADSLAHTDFQKNFISLITTG